MCYAAPSPPVRVEAEPLAAAAVGFGVESLAFAGFLALEVSMKRGQLALPVPAPVVNLEQPLEPLPAASLKTSYGFY